MDRDKKKIPNPVDADTMRYYLKMLALWLVRGDATAKKEAVLELLQKPRPGVCLDAETIYTSLVVRSAIVKEPAEGKVDYIHRTLAYLAASEAVTKDGNYIELVKNANLPGAL